MNYLRRSLNLIYSNSKTISFCWRTNGLAQRNVIGRRMMASSALLNTDLDNLLANSDKKQVDLLQEMCIVVDENDKALYGKTKKECHLMVNINKGLIHRAFSVLIFNQKGEFLLTQRSNEKIIFPNRLTNACCSHPLFTQLEMDETDGIGIKRAAQRRLTIELGIHPLQIPIDELVYMKKILYKEASDEIWGEHEIDYILILQKDVDLNPDLNEVKNCYFLSKNDFMPFLKSEEKKGNLMSPWFKVIVDNFLFTWWDNLGNLEKFQEHSKIHKL